MMSKNKDVIHVNHELVFNTTNFWGTTFVNFLLLVAVSIVACLIVGAVSYMVKRRKVRHRYFDRFYNAVFGLFFLAIFVFFWINLLNGFISTSNMNNVYSNHFMSSELNGDKFVKIANEKSDLKISKFYAIYDVETANHKKYYTCVPKFKEITHDKIKLDSFECANQATENAIYFITIPVKYDK